MSYLVPGIDPLYAVGKNINFNKVRSKEDASREFASIFISQILKDVFKAQSSMFGDEGALGVYSNNLYNDIMISKLSGEIAANKSYNFDKLMTGIK